MTVAMSVSAPYAAEFNSEKPPETSSNGMIVMKLMIGREESRLLHGPRSALDCGTTNGCFLDAFSAES